MLPLIFVLLICPLPLTRCPTLFLIAIIIHLIAILLVTMVFYISVELTSYRDVVCHPEWQHAMAEEIAALERTGTWDLVSPPPGVRPITCKWVYKIKTRSDGYLERYKAHLVASGFQQDQGHDYDETFAPVAHMTTVHTLLAMASILHWSMSQLDVQNAFLNGELHEEVYM
jgi:hypothetical protein